MTDQRQHTPGPWTLMDEHLQNAKTGDDFPTITAWDEGAEVSVTVAIVSPDADEIYANARLIAAAPRLLRELRRARIALEFYGRLVAELSDGKTSYPNGQDVARDARAAIYDATEDIS